MTKDTFMHNIKFKLVISLFIMAMYISNIYATTIPSLYCKNAILIDNDSGKVLYENGQNARVYPASTTKVLTAILALENLDLNSSTVVTETAIDLPYGSSNAALKHGEVMSIKDLLYALMLQSGNDAANVLAEAVSGSIDKFVVLMNEKLSELGCNNSHFANAHGYHDDNHYTTPSDMMKILSYAIKNEKFVEIFSTASYTIEPTNKTNTQRKYQNTNRLMLTKEDSYLSRYYEYCIGGKTGYTDEAGRTLVAYSKKGDKNLILGVFNSNPSGITDLRYTDAINLFEYGFNNFEKTQLLDESNYSFSYTDNDKKLVYNYSMAEDVFALSNAEETSEPLVVNYSVNINYIKLEQYDITSENYKNQVVGSIKMSFRQNASTYDKEFDLILDDISELPATTSEHISNILNKILIIFVIIFVLFILLKILTTLSKKKNRLNKTNISNHDSKSRRKSAYKPRRTLK